MSWTRTRPACFEELLTDAKDTVNASVRKSRLGSNILHLNRTDRSSVSHKSIEYLHRDHLGSVEAVTNESGNVVRAFGFDPFGERRHEDWNRQLSPSEIDSTADEARTGTTRGYTGHENLDRTGLVHMNGRIYDPQTGRFLSPDPVVQAPGYSQSWNRYSYVMGNPVSFNDPSGYVTAGPLCGAGSLALCANTDSITGARGGRTINVPSPITSIQASTSYSVSYDVVTVSTTATYFPGSPRYNDNNQPINGISGVYTFQSIVPVPSIRSSFSSQTSDNPAQIEVPESGQTDEPIERQLDKAFRGLSKSDQQEVRDFFVANWSAIYSEQEVYLGDLVEKSEQGARVAAGGRVLFWLLKKTNIVANASDVALGSVAFSKRMSNSRKLLDYSQKRDSFAIWSGAEIFDMDVKGPWRTFDWAPYEIRGSNTTNMTVDFYLWVTGQVDRRPPSCVISGDCT